MLILALWQLVMFVVGVAAGYAVVLGLTGGMGRGS